MDDFSDFSSDAVNGAVMGRRVTPSTGSVPPAFLNAVIAQESGGNPNAVSPKGARGVMQVMPGTNTAPGYGVSPARDNSEGERSRVGRDYLGAMHSRYNDPAIAAIAYNMGPDATDKWLQSGGDFNKLPNETRNYVGSVMTKTAVNSRAPAQSPAQATAAPAADPFADFSSDSIASAVKGISGPSSSTPEKPNVLTGNKGIPNLGDITSRVGSVLANQATGVGSSIVGGYKGLSSLVSGGSLKDAADAVTDYQQGHTYNPQEGQGAAAISSFASPSNPMNWPGHAIDTVSDRTADAFGPAAGAGVKAVGNLGLLALGLRGKPGTAAVDIGPSRPGTGIYRNVGGAPASQVTQQGPGQTVSPQGMPQQGAPAEAAPNMQLTPQPASNTSRGAAYANDPVPATPQAVQAMAQDRPAALFPETPAVAPSGKFSPEQQIARAKTLESVGIDPNEIRRSAVTGDHLSASTDWETAKVDNSAGRILRSVFEKERTALADYTDKIVESTGGTLDKDQTTLYNRGSTIVQPLNDYKKWFDDQASGLYKAADERAQGTPVQLNEFKDLVGDAGELTNSDRINLQSALQARLKKLGMMGDDGAITGNAQQAETVRKYLNENYSPANGKLVGKLKEALDNDVTKSAGDDIYQQARQLWAQRKNTLDNPNGIAKLMQAEGPDGINRAIPIEQISSKITSMPVDQFGHIVETLKNAPSEIQPQSTAALNEIKAQFANDVKNAGNKFKTGWNTKGVTEYLKKNAATMSQVFTPDEIGQFRNLSDAGQILDKPTAYPGAAAQGYNLAQAGVVKAIPAAGAAIGGFFGGPFGAAAGGMTGSAIARPLGDAALVRNAKTRTMRLSDMLNVGK